MPVSVTTGDILNSDHYVLLRPVALALIRTLRNVTFQQTNARADVASTVNTFLHTENVMVAVLANTFSRSVPNGKHLINGSLTPVDMVGEL